MKKLVLAGLVLAALTTAAPAALAQATTPLDRGTVTVTATTACGRVTLKAVNGRSRSVDVAVFGGRQRDAEHLGTFNVRGSGRTERTFDFAEDAYGGRAQVNWFVVGLNPPVTGGLSVDTDCRRGPGTTTTVAPPETTTVTVTPDPTTTVTVTRPAPRIPTGINTGRA